MKKPERAIIVLLGSPGSGKGTQSEMLHKEFDIPHLSTGDILRDAIKHKTKIGKQAQRYMHKGQLVPNSIVLDLVDSRLKEADCDRGAVFDGFPRNLAQAKFLLELEYVKDAELFSAILLHIPDEDVVKRLSSRRYCPKCTEIYNLITKPPKIDNGSYFCKNCGTELEIRDDDKVETIKNRLEVYHLHAEPVLELFKHKSTLQTVNANQNPRRVSQEILKVLPA